MILLQELSRTLSFAVTIFDFGIRIEARGLKIFSFLRWETHGDWSIHQPLPELRLRLLAEDNSLFALDNHKELARVRI